MRYHKVRFAFRVQSSYLINFDFSIDSNVDYRYSATGEDERLLTFTSPVDAYSDELLQKIFFKLSGSQTG